jgi:hypothetical protein
MRSHSDFGQCFPNSVADLERFEVAEEALHGATRECDCDLRRREALDPGTATTISATAPRRCSPPSKSSRIKHDLEVIKDHEIEAIETIDGGLEVELAPRHLELLYEVGASVGSLDNHSLTIL